MNPDDADEGPAFPAVVRFAGMLAAGQAALLLALGAGLGAVGVLEVLALAGVGGPAGLGLGELALVGGALLIAVGGPYLWFAVSVVLRRPGAARGLGNWALGTAAAVGGMAAFQAVNEPTRLAVPAAAGGFAVALALPGVLALAGRRQLRAWRAHHRRGA